MNQYRFYVVQNPPYAKLLTCSECYKQLVTAEVFATKDPGGLGGSNYSPEFFNNSIVNCVECTIKDMFKIMLCNVVSVPSSETGRIIGDGIASIIKYGTTSGLNELIRTTIRNEIKQLMKEEAHNPDGAFSP
jgi:hypothetical protein